MRVLGTANMLFVKDFERMTAFYEGSLALVPEPSPYEGYRRYPLGDGAFVLHAIPASIAEAIEIDDPAVVREGVPVKPVFYVEDVAAARDELLALGVVRLTTDRPASDDFDDFVDPEGNVFQVARA